ncbi:MAG: proton-conducting transporter membrane subunit, partial [Phycisphaerales bacterium]|nr:proton-conducting transporter membrane subunit [Phycisphaerales bacterium]
KKDSKGNRQDADDIEDLRGLCKTHPLLGWTVVLCALSMLGFPPLLGFIGKLGLFASGISAGQYPIVIILGINSAIAAVYYLRLVAVAYLDKGDNKAPSTITLSPYASRRIAGACSAIGVVLLLLVSQPLVNAALHAASFNAPDRAHQASHDSSHALIDPADHSEHE